MPLTKYREKRNFRIIPEPSGGSSIDGRAKAPLLYVVQKHRATQLHYVFRLEWNRVLHSWSPIRR
jgi:bifunctional non-homologous end joining protein LigD